jgi:hypothetical protein
MPESDAPYLVERLQGTGAQMDIGLDYNPLVSRMMRIRDSRDAWIREYMHESIGDQSCSFLVIDQPVPLAIGIAVDHETLGVTIEVRYRMPMREGLFEVRVGPEPWSPGLATLGYQETVAEPDGWQMTRFFTRVPTAGDFTVWVTRTEIEEDFDWRIPIPIGDPDPATTGVRFVIDTWFALTNAKGAATYINALQPRPPNAQSGMPDGRYFEVALHATFTAMGMPSLHGGKTLTTPGVDIFAFDHPNRLLFAVSALTSADVEGKLAKWRQVRDAVVAAAKPEWAVKPVIITNRPLTEVGQRPIEAAYHEGVMVLGAKDLDCLKDSPPNLESFGKTLRLTLFGRQAGYKLVPLPNADSGWRIVDLS